MDTRPKRFVRTFDFGSSRRTIAQQSHLRISPPHAYLFLCLVLGPGRFAILLAQGLLLLVVQQRVVLVVAHNLALVVLQHLSQDGILRKRGRHKKGQSHPYSGGTQRPLER